MNGSKSILQWIITAIAVFGVVLSAGILLGSVTTNTRDIKSITNEVGLNRADISRLKRDQAVTDDRWKRIEKWMSEIDRKLER